MKKKLSIIFFIMLQLFFAILQIHKNSILVKNTYEKQKNELIIKKLKKDIDNLNIEINIMKNKSKVYDYCYKKLNMKKYKISFLKEIKHK